MITTSTVCVGVKKLPSVCLFVHVFVCVCMFVPVCVCVCIKVAHLIYLLSGVVGEVHTIKCEKLGRSVFCVWFVQLYLTDCCVHIQNHLERHTRTCIGYHTNNMRVFVHKRYGVFGGCHGERGLNEAHPAFQLVFSLVHRATSHDHLYRF